MVTVTGTLQYVFNNDKEVLLGFSNPHRGDFKVLIRQAHADDTLSYLDEKGLRWYDVHHSWPQDAAAQSTFSV